MRRVLTFGLFLSLISAPSAPALAVIVPFVEDFGADAAGWTNSSNTSFLSHHPAGGPQGGAYVSTQFAFSTGGGAGGSSAVIFRAHDEFHASGDVLIGDWATAGVRTLSADVYHEAPVPLSFFTRFSGPLNFPGAVAVAFAPAPPRQWTTLSFDVSPGSPQIVSLEGADYGAVFSNIGHVAVGVQIPRELASDPALYTFGLDRVSLAVPEPSSVALLFAGCLAGSSLLLRRVGGFHATT
jgi:hypothetical protein